MTTSPLPPSLAPERRSNMLPILAMTMAAIGLALSVLPSALLFAAPALALAVTLATVALVKKLQGSKGLSFAAIGTAVVGLVVATAVAFTSLASATQAAPVSGDAEVAQEDAAAEPPLDAGVSASVKQELSLVEAEFGRTTMSGEWWFVLMLDNSRATSMLLNVPITTEAIDANGLVVATSADSLTAVPGRNVIIGKFSVSASSDITALDVSVPLPTLSISMKDQKPGLSEASNVTAEANEHGTTTVRGDLTNISDEEVTGVLITVIARDPAGKIIAFANAEAASLAGSATTAFEARFDLAVPADAELEVFVEP